MTVVTAPSLVVIRYGRDVWSSWRRLDWRNESGTSTETLSLAAGENISRVNVRGHWKEGNTWSLEMTTSGGRSFGPFGDRNMGNLRVSPAGSDLVLKHLSGREGHKDGYYPDWVTCFHWTRNG